MNEMLLLIVVIVLIFGIQILVKRINKPISCYVRISASIGLLLLIWLFGNDSGIPIRVILSVLALSNVYREFLYLQKTTIEKRRIN